MFHSRFLADLSFFMDYLVKVAECPSMSRPRQFISELLSQRQNLGIFPKRSSVIKGWAEMPYPFYSTFLVSISVFLLIILVYI